MTGVIFILLGIALIGFGLARARGPWQRYQALRDQDANAARYDAWRGGIRSSGTTGASVAMEVLRRQARNGATIAAVGVLLVIIGFFFR